MHKQAMAGSAKDPREQGSGSDPWDASSGSDPVERSSRVGRAVLLALGFLLMTAPAPSVASPLKPGVGFTPSSHVTVWVNHDGTTHSGALNPFAVLTSAVASIDARYGAGASQRWFWRGCDNENLRNIGGLGLSVMFAAGRLGSASEWDGNPTVTEMEDACATGDPQVLAAASQVPADATPVQMAFPGEPCGVFSRIVPPFALPRPVLNKSPACVPVGAPPVVPVTPPVLTPPVVFPPVAPAPCWKAAADVASAMAKVPAGCGMILPPGSVILRPGLPSTGALRIVVVPDTP